MSWVLIVVFLLAVAALALTLGAVALRPAQRTARAAAAALLVLPALVILTAIIASIGN